MTTEPYNYELIAQHPKLLALYSGWLGQKICFLTHSAVTWDRSDLWSAAASEMDRFALVLHEAEKAKVLGLSDETGAALGECVGCFASGGWWMSNDGASERMACQQARREEDEFSGHEFDTGGSSFLPRLLLECDVQYSVAPAVLRLLDTVLLQAAVAMDNLDECRLGVSLSGFGYRSTAQLGIPFINSVLDNLAACDMTDLESENEFRRAVGLSEISEDRRPRSLTDPALPPPIVPEDVTAGSNRQGTFAPYVGDMTDHRGLVLGCVFNRFGVVVPPTESDASQYAELAGLKKKLQAGSAKATKSAGRAGLAEQTEFWTQEAIEYLGFNRLDVARPDMLLQRLIKKGALRPTKIGRRNVFKKADLDRVREKGDQVRRRGRPRKDEK
jgi:hypothetical protein